MPALVLVALLGQSTPVPDTTITVHSSEIVVTVQPPDGRTVKSVAVQRDTDKKARAPRLVEPRERDGVRATFERPHTEFTAIVTLDDGAIHRLDERQSVYTVRPFLGDVLPVRPLPSPPY